jgi:hypothetical protein
MKIKYLIVCVCFIAACTKTSIETPVNTFSADQSTATAKAILTAHKWMYKAFYMHYIDQNHKGDPLYVRGASNNPDEIIGTDRFTFKTNNTFSQVEGDYVYTGTWSFSDNKPTNLIMNYDWGTDRDSIVKIELQHLNFIQSFGYHDQDHSFTQLIPAQ